MMPKSTLSTSYRTVTAWKVSKYGAFSGPYFSAFGLNKERYYLSVFSPNAGKYVPEKTPYLDTFHTVGFSYSCHLFHEPLRKWNEMQKYEKREKYAILHEHKCDNKFIT